MIALLIIFAVIVVVCAGSKDVRVKAPPAIRDVRSDSIWSRYFSYVSCFFSPLKCAINSAPALRSTKTGPTR